MPTTQSKYVEYCSWDASLVVTLLVTSDIDATTEVCNKNGVQLCPPTGGARDLPYMNVYLALSSWLPRCGLNCLRPRPHFFGRKAGGSPILHLPVAARKLAKGRFLPLSTVNVYSVQGCTLLIDAALYARWTHY